VAKKNENILGLSSLPKPMPGLETDTSLTPFQANRKLARAERKVIAEFHKEQLIMDATAKKTIYGETKIGELHQHTAAEFDGTVGFILGIKNEPGRTVEHQAYIDAFSHRQVQMLAGHLSGALDIGATNIGIEVQRSLFFADEEERRGFFARLFGVRDE
jgi:hypothetical protein